MSSLNGSLPMLKPDHEALKIGQPRSPMPTLPRFLVIQNGARHNYAIPTAFHRAGVLSSLCTDFTSNRPLGILLARMIGKDRNLASALARRQPPKDIEWAVRTSDAAFFTSEALKFLLRGENGRGSLINISKSMAERTMLWRGTGDATHIYTMLGEGGHFVRRAKENGLGVVGDVYIALSADRIVCEEESRFPDWSPHNPNTSVTYERQRNGVLLECSDLLVCPSEYVRDDLVAHHGVDASRTCVIPYAVNSNWLFLATKPEKGRALFAGTANLRKGIHYLAAAATLLKGSCTIFVAGGVSEKVRNHPAARDLIFLGHLSKAHMAAEFKRADVFVFPSLAEGAASVCAEALGAGVPVVTTRAAGSIVRDGIDGIIVPERDPEALAEAVLSIIVDRGRRAAMSYAARERAQMFTWDRFARDVIEATLAATLEKRN